MSDKPMRVKIIMEFDLGEFPEEGVSRSKEHWEEYISQSDILFLDGELKEVIIESSKPESSC